MDYLNGLSPEEPCRTKYHYRSTHVHVHGRVLKGDAIAKFLQKANLVGSCTVANFTTVMATITVHTYAYCDKRRYMQSYLRKPPEMKVRSFTTRLIQLNTYLPYFPPDRPGQLVTSLPHDDIKGILYHAMPNTMWKKKMVEKRYNHLDGPILFLWQNSSRQG